LYERLLVKWIRHAMCSPRVWHTTGETRPCKNMPWCGTARRLCWDSNRWGAVRRCMGWVSPFVHHWTSTGNGKAEIPGGC